MIGNDVFVGSPTTTAVWFDVAVADPASLTALTETRMVASTSASATA
jgi:hypothetical protein